MTLVIIAARKTAVPYSMQDAITGCLLGTAVGDALGLACEGLSRRRQAKMFRTLDSYKLLPIGKSGKGMTSDDTEHTCMLAQSLIVTGHGELTTLEQKFSANFAWRLRLWLLGLPAGIGFATLRAILKLWLGFPARHSGVFSAGNGPAMRAALIGVCHGNEPARMRALVRAATRITHTDPKAEFGAFAVATAALVGWGEPFDKLRTGLRTPTNRLTTEYTEKSARSSFRVFRGRYHLVLGFPSSPQPTTSADA